eukprot:scaffold84_cov388-Prasinococcus_capsulatus_cf.AAC.6
MSGAQCRVADANPSRRPIWARCWRLPCRLHSSWPSRPSPGAPSALGRLSTYVAHPAQAQTGGACWLSLGAQGGREGIPRQHRRAGGIDQPQQRHSGKALPQQAGRLAEAAISPGALSLQSPNEIKLTRMEEFMLAAKCKLKFFLGAWPGVLTTPTAHATVLSTSLAAGVDNAGRELYAALPQNS